MSPKSINWNDENLRLAQKYRPLLVLYPEIADGSRRADHHHSIGDNPASGPPLDQDYHPRDIRLVLNHALLPGRSECSREELLDAMSANTVKHIDLIDKKGPKDVDKFWRVYADIADKDMFSEYHRKAYARVVRGSGLYEGYISIQYWLAYFFDDWANVHEMDWEMVSVIVRKEGAGEKPVGCVFNAHIGAFRKPWARVQKVDDEQHRSATGLHPVAYVANGSHASYFSEYPPYFNVSEPYLKTALRKLIRLIGVARPFTDYLPSYGQGTRCFPEVELVPEPDEFGQWQGDFRWLNFKGQWGSPRQLSWLESIIARIPLVRKAPLFFQRPIRESGPTGPTQKGACWTNPLVWADMECWDTVESHSWIKGMDENMLPKTDSAEIKPVRNRRAKTSER